MKKGVIDLSDVMEALSAQPTADWATFQPIRAYIIEEAAEAFPTMAPDRASTDAIYWPHFAWLAEENGKWLAAKVSIKTDLA